MSNDGRDGDIDARFDDIMSHWDDPVGGPHEPAGPRPGKSINPAPHYRIIPRPEGDDPAGAEPGTGPPDADEHGAVDRSAQDAEGEERAAEASGSDWRSRPLTPEEEDEGHFVPPPPAPLPAGDLQFWGILVGLIGGPGLLLYLIMFDRDAGTLWTAIAIALSLGGFGLLVVRLPSHRDEDDGDDGARV